MMLYVLLFVGCFVLFSIGVPWELPTAILSVGAATLIVRTLAKKEG